MRRIVSKLAAATAGLSPHKIALIVAVGLVLGAFPVYGCPTILCCLAAIALRLNLPALQLVNQIATPAQFALLIPLARTGSWIFGSRAGFGGAVWNAVAGWACLSVPMGVLLYITLQYALRRSATLPSGGACFSSMPHTFPSDRTFCVDCGADPLVRSRRPRRLARHG